MADIWVGYQNNNGPPDDGSANWVDYSNQADRFYGRRWTATGLHATNGGTITHINVRYPSEVVPGPNGVCLTVIVNGTTVGYVDVVATITGSTWSGELAVTAMSGQSLDVSNGDEIDFGIAFDGDGTNYCGISRDNNLSDGYNRYASITFPATGLPPASITTGASGTYQGAGAILRLDNGIESVALDSSFEAGNGIEAATFESPAGTFNVITECDPSPADDAWGDWFYFSLSGVNGDAPSINVDFTNNRAGGPYWNTHSDMRPVWSYDGITWTRVSSATYSTSTHILSFSLPTMSQDTVYVAADIPALWSDLESDITTWAVSQYCTSEVLSYGGVTSSQGGRNMYYLRIEDTGSGYINKYELIITARAHPGEAQAGWHMKGMIDWILSADATAVALRERCVLHIFPCVNPDGVYAGRLRSFNDGTDGNRGWDTSGPSSSTEPDETFLIHSKIDDIQGNIRHAIDLHGNDYDSPRVVYDATNDDWPAQDLTDLVNALNALDNPTPDYWYDDVYNMVTSYTTNFRRGQIVSYGYNVLGTEGGMHDTDAGDYPSAADRESAGADLLQALIDTFEEAGVAYQFAATISGQSVTPDIALAVARSLAAAPAGQSDTSDIVLSVARQFNADISAQSLTSAIDLTIAALGLIINPSLRSVTVQRSLKSV